MLDQSTWQELFKVLGIVASAAFTERSPQIAESLAKFIAGLLQEVTLSPTAEVVVKHCVDLLLSTEDFPEKSAINILVKAFSASSPELASSFVHPAATRALALLKDPACDDTSTRNA